MTFYRYWSNDNNFYSSNWPIPWQYRCTIYDVTTKLRDGFELALLDYSDITHVLFPKTFAYHTINRIGNIDYTFVCIVCGDKITHINLPDHPSTDIMHIYMRDHFTCDHQHANDKLRKMIEDIPLDTLIHRESWEHTWIEDDPGVYLVNKSVEDEYKDHLNILPVALVCEIYKTHGLLMTCFPSANVRAFDTNTRRFASLMISDGILKGLDIHCLTCGDRLKQFLFRYHNKEGVDKDDVLTYMKRCEISCGCANETSEIMSLLDSP